MSVCLTHAAKGARAPDPKLHGDMVKPSTAHVGEDRKKEPLAVI